jgi:hypothetical protein
VAPLDNEDGAPASSRFTVVEKMPYDNTFSTTVASSRLDPLTDVEKMS